VTPGGSAAYTSRSRGGTATLIGFSEYGTASTPAKKYRNLAVAGNVYYGTWTTAGCPASGTTYTVSTSGVTTNASFTWALSFNTSTGVVTADLTGWTCCKFVVENNGIRRNGVLVTGGDFGTGADAAQPVAFTRTFSASMGDVIHGGTWNSRHAGNGSAQAMTPNIFDWTIQPGANTLLRDEWIKSGAYDASTGTLTSTDTSLRYTNSSGGTFPLSSGGTSGSWSGFGYEPDNSLAYGSGVSLSLTKTTRTYTGPNVCAGTGPYDKRSGSVVYTLTTEDTDANAITRLLATSPSWSSWTSATLPGAACSHTARTTGFSFTYGEAELKVDVTGFPAGFVFTLRAQIVRIDTATSELSLVATQDYLTTADGAGAATVTIGVEADEAGPNGYTYKVNHVEWFHAP
jgi:hypothetical protein